MNLDSATLNLVFVGTPGVICYFILTKLIGRLGRNSVEAFLLIFMYAVVAYVGYAYLGRIISYLGVDNTAAQLVLASPATLKFRAEDVFWASLVAVALPYVLAFGYRYNVVNRFGQFIRATNRIGDEDVWHFLHNASTEPWSSEWLVVRDHRVNLQYFGAVSQWSESGEDRELLLTDVSVFRNNDGAKLYNCEHLYICRNKEELTLEIHRDGKGLPVGGAKDV